MMKALLWAALCAPAPSEINEWTVLFFGAADNSSEESFVPDMENLMQGLPVKGLEVLAFVDRSPGYSSQASPLGGDFADVRLFRLTAEGAQRCFGGTQFPELVEGKSYEANSGDVATLRKALRWAKANYPARRYGLVFYSHGGGDAWCPDESHDDRLYPAELNAGLTQEDSLDLVVFDVCLMGGIENAYQWRPREGSFGAEICVATPMAGFPFPWGQIFRNLRAEHPEQAPSAAEFGQLIVRSVEEDRAQGLAQGAIPEGLRAEVELEAMGCYDLTQAGRVKQATDAVARALAGSEELRSQLETLRGHGQEVGLLNYMGLDKPTGWSEYPYFDLHDLARRIPLIDSASEELLEAAADLEEAVEAMVLGSFGMPGYDPYDFVPGASGLYVVFPEGPNSWANFRWYTGEALPDGAPGFGRYDWCLDGASERPGQVGNWFQLLESWYARP